MLDFIQFKPQEPLKEEREKERENKLNFSYVKFHAIQAMRAIVSGARKGKGKSIYLFTC